MAPLEPLDPEQEQEQQQREMFIRDSFASGSLASPSLSAPLLTALPPLASPAASSGRIVMGDKSSRGGVKFVSDGGFSSSNAFNSAAARDEAREARSREALPRPAGESGSLCVCV